MAIRSCCKHSNASYDRDVNADKVLRQMHGHESHETLLACMKAFTNIGCIGWHQQQG